MIKREIKFRMWTGTNMLYDDKNVIECLRQQRFFDTGTPLNPAIGVWPYDHIGEGKSYFMQFTGLKDKNLKDVYAGDIVQIIYDFPDEGVEPRFAIGFVDWNEHSTGWIIRTKSPMSVSDDGTVMTSLIHGPNGEREVMGNIYQNPELISKL